VSESNVRRGLAVDAERLVRRLAGLNAIGALEGGGVTRLALSDEDKRGRDFVVALMRELGLEVRVDRFGNVVGVRPGSEGGPPVMTGSHLDTVRAGGRYDGALGVLAGLEAVAALNDAGVTTRRPLAVAFFTNEEGVRFAPDMMGSMVHQGHLPLEDMLGAEDGDGTTVGEALERIGYAGDDPCGTVRPHAFVELHIEQGPVLEREGITIGAVEGVQGISWTGIEVRGKANHAGTTPMALRRDAGVAVGAVIGYARRLARDIGGGQVATVGRVELKPNVVNVIPGRASLTVDLRNFDERRLALAEARLAKFLGRLAQREGLEIGHRSLARYPPVAFDPRVIELVEATAAELGHSVRRLPSGAGHDAQAFAASCPTAMIFVPSAGGVSHNPDEHTDVADIEAGANVLLQVLLELAS